MILTSINYIINELIEVFKDMKHISSQLEFELILLNGSLENSIDVGGVFKDVLSVLVKLLSNGYYWMSLDNSSYQLRFSIG